MPNCSHSDICTGKCSQCGDDEIMHSIHCTDENDDIEAKMDELNLKPGDKVKVIFSTGDVVFYEITEPLESKSQCGNKGNEDE